MSFPSPNHGERRGTQRPDLIVLHYTGMSDAASARARLCDPTAEVSAHWLLYEDGRPEALVPEHRRAWHAGAGSWRGRDDVNSHSVGIEIVNPGDRPFPAPQMTALEQLLRQIMSRWDIGPAGVIGHSDMAPGRKFDPGARFDWCRLAAAGVAIWPDARGSVAPIPSLADSLDRIGYPAGSPAVRLATFRLRFRPGSRGSETPEDCDVAARLAEQFSAFCVTEPR